MISYKEKVIELLVKQGFDKDTISCDLYYDKIAQEKLYHVTYLNKGLKTLSKARFPIKAWRRAFEKLNRNGQESI